jgi:D-alanine--poly(phosphoribitol) ligase subunit 1
LNKNYEFQIEDCDESGVGELILIGSQIALGYINDARKTREKFIFFDETSGYCKSGYKTGDLVYLDNNNLLNFKGRADFQIKHMGYRIELEEIENWFLKSGELLEAVATYEKKDAHSQGRIILHYVTEQEVAISDRALTTVFRKVEKILPSYMRPSEYIRHDKLPKNQNGKIDRKGLENG